MLGSCPRDQAGKVTEARCDFRWRGGTLMISRAKSSARQNSRNRRAAVPRTSPHRCPRRRSRPAWSTGRIGGAGGRGRLGCDLAAQARGELLGDLLVPGVNLSGSGGATAPAFCSTSFIMSNSILVARRSALTDLLTICATIASRLVILRRCPTSTASGDRRLRLRYAGGGARLQAGVNRSRRRRPADNLPCSTDLIPC